MAGVRDLQEEYHHTCLRSAVYKQLVDMDEATYHSAKAMQSKTILSLAANTKQEMRASFHDLII